MIDNFNIPVHISLNNTQQILIIQCSLKNTTWTCQSIKYPNSIASSHDLKSAIKEVVDHVKINHQNNNEKI